MTMDHGGGGFENKGYEGDGNIKTHYKRSHSLNSVQREKVNLTQSEKWRILKNIGVVSFAFMMQFTAFQVSFFS